MPRKKPPIIILRPEQVTHYLSTLKGVYQIDHFHDDDCPKLRGTGRCRCNVALSVRDYRGELVAMMPAAPTPGQRTN